MPRGAKKRRDPGRAAGGLGARARTNCRPRGGGASISSGSSGCCRTSLDHRWRPSTFGPALELQRSVTRGQVAAARPFGTIAPNLPAQPVDDSELVSTPQARQALADDPLIDYDESRPHSTAEIGF